MEGERPSDAKLPQESAGFDDERLDNEIRDLFRLVIVSVLIFPIPLVLYAIYRLVTLPTSVASNPRVKKKIRRYSVFILCLTVIVLLFWFVMFIGPALGF